MKNVKPLMTVPEDSVMTKTPLIGSPHEWGIPLEYVVFQDSVQSFQFQRANQTPETALYHSEIKKQKQANLWKSGDTLVFEQAQGVGLIPWAKVKHSKFLKKV